MKRSNLSQIILTALGPVVILIALWMSGNFTVATVGFVFAMIALLAGFFWLVWKIGNARKIKNGIPARATVINCQKGGVVMVTGKVDKSYVLKMEINVTTETGESWRTKLVEHIPADRADLFQPGYDFHVLYDPDNHNKVMLDRSE